MTWNAGLSKFFSVHRNFLRGNLDGISDEKDDWQKTSYLFGFTFKPHETVEDLPIKSSLIPKGANINFQENDSEPTIQLFYMQFNQSWALINYASVPSF